MDPRDGAAAFGGENETELSCAKGELLLVDGGDPGSDGWVVAGRFPDAAETGLVPDSYLRKHEFQWLRDGYEAIGDGELSLKPARRSSSAPAACRPAAGGSRARGAARLRATAYPR